MSNVKIFLLLHTMLIIYSLSGICGKLASEQPIFSFNFFLFYAAVIGLLGVYAVGWQQIIKYLPLTMAFANKAITVVWGFIWGVCFFHEKVTTGKVIGAVLVIIGIVFNAYADKGEQSRNND